MQFSNAVVILELPYIFEWQQILMGDAHMCRVCMALIRIKGLCSFQCLGLCRFRDWCVCLVEGGQGSGIRGEHGMLGLGVVV